MVEKCKGYLKNIFQNSPKAKFMFASIVMMTICLVMLALMGATLRKTVTINIDGNEQTFVTYKGTVGDVLEEAGVEVTAEDKVQPALDETIEGNDSITVKKAVEVEIITKDNSITISTAEDTVGDMLEAEQETLVANGIEYDSSIDEVSPAVETDIEEGLSITLVDVEVQQETVVQEIPYDTVTQEDSSLAINTSQVIQEGQAGEEEITYEVVIKDGIEVSREQTGAKVLKDAVTEVVAEGTKKTVTTSSSGVLTYESVVYCQATAYCTGTVTATGIAPVYNPSGTSTISVDPSVIPLGSLVYVEGYGIAIAADTGGAINGNIIDVYVNSYDEAVSWGRQYNVGVYILAGPGEW